MRVRWMIAWMAYVLAMPAQTPTPAEEAVAARLVALPSDAARRQLLETEHVPETPTLVRAVIASGNRLQLKTEYAAAVACYRFALDMAERMGDRAMQGSSWYSLGIGLQSLGDLEQTLDAYTRSLALSREAGLANWQLASRLNSLSIVHRHLGNYPEAIRYARESLAAAEGITAEELRQPVAVSQKISAGLMRAQALNSLASAQSDMSDNASALQSYDESYRLALAENRREGAALVMNNVGLIHQSQGNLALALEYFSKSLKLLEEVGNQMHLANGYFNIGSIYRETGKYEAAMENMERVQRLGEQSGDKGVIAEGLLGVARVERAQGRFALAIGNFEKSAATYHTMGDPSAEAIALAELADAQIAFKEYAKAAGNAAQAVTLARQIGDLEALRKACSAAGRANLHLGRNGEARARFEEAIGAIESERAGVAGSEETRERFFEDKLAPYTGMVRMALAEGRAEEALAFAERAKARVVLDAFAAGRVRIAKAMTAEEKDREQALSTRMASLNARIADQKSRTAPTPGLIGQLEKRLEEARLEYAALESSLYAAHPQLRANRLETRAPSVREIAAQLPDERSVALEYVVSEEGTTLFVVSKNAPHLRRYAIRMTSAELSGKVRRYAGKLARRDLDFGAEGRELYRVLVEPATEALRGKSTVLIVPDGALWQLPFQALMPEPEHYWIEQAAIFYAPSLSVVVEMLHRKPRLKPAADRTLMAMGNPASANPSLPDAQLEVEALRAVYGAANSKIYTGEEASEATFKRQAGQFQILHLAAHAELDDRNPMYSHLVLARGRSGAQEDGMLEAREMMDLDLKAEVVVLSACETAAGRVGAGEGFIGMTWALFIAGAPATVATSWKIDSASAARFSLEFHRAFERGQPRASALRDAAMTVMKLPGYQHPYHWSGFSLLGLGF